ncbi:amidohydrolase [Cytobacillus purgationiresistens]|uniref:Cytosine/adenosine deaminase-related metal-dependent hydrolase n=1 Tax=Cytobacillus purgationiresistens TaxID=863449 RepID=A0ABU0AGN5_9BACI|nr:amidohydrolase [Cytobacillus purgationiresistens]MDQ0270421.1 cytosine/adenosine deaminase-related metal-dependent hydrolase [Cytobacillus purgationiresistens]
MSNAFWLTNVLLESGYQMKQGLISSTKAERFNLLIKEGKIAKVQHADEANPDNLPQKDARGLLVLPSFTEKHCHLDKTLLGDRWRSVTPANHIFERLEIEKNTLPSLETTTKERAEKLIDIYLKNGVTHIRTHVDIYPEVGLSNLKEVQKALHTFEGKLSYEIVAFPQHGFLRSNSLQLVREALQQGACIIGGVDPATVDGDIEASLQAMVDLAVAENAGIDLHLHDADHLGIYTIKRLAKLTKEAGLQGRVTISHAYCLGEIPREQVKSVAEQLADAGITIVTSVPIDSNLPPVELLRSEDVPVAIGCDNIFDVWSPFGNGDILERAGRLAEISKWTDERSLAQTLAYITDGKTPLNSEGKQIWPQEGSDANLVFIEATCSAEAIARKSKRIATMFQGKMVSGNL